MHPCSIGNNSILSVNFQVHLSAKLDGLVPRAARAPLIGGCGHTSGMKRGEKLKNKSRSGRNPAGMSMRYNGMLNSIDWVWSKGVSDTNTRFVALVALVKREEAK